MVKYPDFYSHQNGGLALNVLEVDIRIQNEYHKINFHSFLGPMILFHQ